MTRSLFDAAAIRAGEARADRARLAPPVQLTLKRDAAPGYVTAEPGCHDCGHWQRANAATGRCQILGERAGWLTSYAYVCPDHEENATS